MALNLLCEEDCSVDILQPSVAEPNFSQQDICTYADKKQRPIRLVASLWIKKIATILKPSITIIDLLCYWIIILHHVRNASILSLPLMFMVLLWGALQKPRPSTTFWIIVIAYTGVSILLKWLFKLKVFVLEETDVWFSTLIIDVKMEVLGALLDVIAVLVIIFLRLLVKCLGLDFQYQENGYHGSEEGNFTNMRRVIPAPSQVLQNSLTDCSIEQYPEDNLRRERSKEVGSTQHQSCCSMARMKELLIKKFCSSSVWHFFHDLLDEPTHCGVDVYRYIFFCDVISFVIPILECSGFGFGAIGHTGIIEYLAENKVPTQFLMVAILQFALIIGDRTFYLRRCIGAKIIMYVCLAVVVHVGVFILVPSATNSKLSRRVALLIWYMVKCCWFLLSAYQIRQGYPRRTIGNCLCNYYSVFNFILVKGFMVVPFLFEFRTVLDWLSTETSLVIFDWLEMEGIYYSAFQVKCLEIKRSHHQGPPKKPALDYVIGGGILFLIIGVILFPMILFSFSMHGNNLPSEVTVTMRINEFPPIYSMSVQSDDVISMDDRTYGKMRSTYTKNDEATDFLNQYANTDVAVIKLDSRSESTWDILEQQREDLIEIFNSNTSVNISMTWSLSWEELGEEEIVSANGTHVHVLEAEIDGKPTSERIELMKLLHSQQQSTVISNVFPKFIRFSKRGESSVVPYLMDTIYSPEDKSYRNVMLHCTGDNSSSWCEVKESCIDANFDIYLKKYSTYDIHCHNLVLFAFNDQPLPTVLMFFSKTGLFGLYLGVVYIVSMVSRSILGINVERLIFTDMLNVDCALKIYADIHKARDARDFASEGDLYERLLSLFLIHKETSIDKDRSSCQKTVNELSTAECPV